MDPQRLTPSVRVSCPEALRILSLPPDTPVDGAQIDAMSRHCRKVPGVRLRAMQVKMLRDACTLPGVFADMPVGSGKTLPLFLLPWLLKAERPMLMLPADLFRTSDKTQRDFARYFKEWRVLLPELRSFEEMARKDRARVLEDKRPDLLMADEADPLKNQRNAVSRRVARYRQSNPDAKMVFASGTLISEKLNEYAHLADWALREWSPAPRDPYIINQWSDSMDSLMPDIPVPDFDKRFRESRGVVCGEGTTCPHPLYAEVWLPALPHELAQLIEDTKISGMRPDGELLDELQMPTTLASLSCGLYHVWDPLPPEWWLTPRRAYTSWLRDTHDLMIPYLDTYDQIAYALDRTSRYCGKPHLDIIPDPPQIELGRALRKAWVEVEDKFTPNSKPVWVDRTRVTEMIQRVDQRGWLLWAPWEDLGHEFERQGIPYYAGGGDNPERADGRTIAVAQSAHYRGKNLQHYHANLITYPSASLKINEQLLGRTHRSGQERAVTAVYRCAIESHSKNLGLAYKKALDISTKRQANKKLALAQWR